MAASASLRPARAVRIYCPVRLETLRRLAAGESDALYADPVLGRMLTIIRAENPLGDFGLYKGVVEISTGFESFRPTAEAKPASGEPGQLTVSPTVIITTFIRDDAPEELVAASLNELVAAHPWEVPVMEMFQTSLVER